MQPQRKPKKRRLQRRRRKPSEELASNQMPPTNADTILNMQQTLGNQAVMRMLQNTAAPPKPKSTFNPSSFKIQRMPSVNDAQTLIYDSERGSSQQTKSVIINMLREYHEIMNGGYEENFPSADEIRMEKADKYTADTISHLQALAKTISIKANELKATAENRAGGKTFKKDKSKHRQRAANMNQFLNINGGIDKSAKISRIIKARHHSALMAKMTGAQDLNFLTTDDIVGDVEDDAIAGGVHSLGKGQMQTEDGIKTGYMKQDESSPDDAGAMTDISRQDGKQGLRAVATYQISELLQMGIIPYTALTKSEDEEGNVTTGQFMEEAKGFTGRGKAVKEALPDDKQQQAKALLDELKSDDTTSDRKGEIESEITDLVGFANSQIGIQEGNDGRIYQLEHAAADIDWMTPVLQKDLSTLQLFDIIIAHADRHAENYIVETGEDGSITGAKGIDNDSVWGKRVDKDMMEDKGDWGFNRVLKTPDLPPVIDAEVALRVVSTHWNSIERILAQYTMKGDEIDAARGRWDYVQEGVKAMIMGNKLATMTLDNHQEMMMYARLYTAIGENPPQGMWNRQMMTWGEETEDLMSEGSYISEIENNYNRKVNPDDYA